MTKTMYWIIVAFLFLVGLWPIGLLMLIFVHERNEIETIAKSIIRKIMDMIEEIKNERH